MDTGIEVRVVKPKVWALKNLQTESKRNSMNIRNWRMHLNVQTEVPWSQQKLTSKLYYAILKNPQSTDADFSISGQWKIPELQQMPYSEVEYDSSLGSSFTLSNADYFAQ